MRKLLLSFSILILLLTSLVLVWAWWEHSRDPLNAIDFDTSPLRGVRDSAYTAITDAGEERIYRDVILRAGEAGLARITLSLPPEQSKEPLPVVLILGGLRHGRENLTYIPRHGQNILIGYEYPYNQRTWYESTKIFEIPKIRRAVLSVPAQITAVVKWLESHPRASKTKINLLGYSFGALFIPATNRLAYRHDIQFATSTLAYGGTNIYRLLHTNLRWKPRWLRKPVAWVAKTAIRTAEPALHLPYMQGEFLVMNGKYDEQIPSASAREFQELAPGPKTVIILNKGHMHPRKPELNALIVKISEQWLMNCGVINPI